MNITSVRLGFATNSSSSHSILLTNSPPSQQSSVWTNDYEYGWEGFILTERDEKMRYLAMMVQMHLVKLLPKKQAAIVTRDLFRDVINLDTDSVAEGYIDHQSVTPFPDDMSGEALAKYVDHLISVFSDPSLVIVGGNDNGGDPLEDIGYAGERIDLGGPALSVRRDGAALVFFNRNTGAKIRFHPSGHYDKALTPELVDVKITDYCPYGCAFCYQGSTKKGTKTAKISYYAVLSALERLGVFEVALGGGEPTESEDFIRWINEAHRHGIIPNFTTYSTKWLKDADKVAAAKTCGGIGVSVHRLKDIDKVQRIKKEMGVEKYSYRQQVRVTAQHVFGTLPLDETLELIEALWKNDISVLLLGYKTTGFGSKYTPHDMTGFDTKLKLMRERVKSIPKEWYACTLSADTAFVEAYKQFLDTMEVAPELAASPEGKFSCYIDAVEGTIAPSSYGDATHTHKLAGENLSAEIKEAFEKF